MGGDPSTVSYILETLADHVGILETVHIDYSTSPPRREVLAA